MNENHELFLHEICEWLQERGFVNDRGWEKKQESGMMFYSFFKGNYRFEIRLNWHRPIVLSIIDCEKEVYRNSDYIGWMNQKLLNTFEKPFSRTLFNELCEHYGI